MPLYSPIKVHKGQNNLLHNFVHVMHNYVWIDTFCVLFFKPIFFFFKTFFGCTTLTKMGQNNVMCN